jgi:transketolase
VSEQVTLAQRAARVRRHVVEMAAGPQGAHLGGSLSAADILTALYFSVLRLRPERPDWPGRDYFVLSKGHCAAGLYAVLAERGFFPVAELATYACFGSRLAGHPTRAVEGVEFPTGSLGHGLALGVGLALAAQRDGRDNRTFVLLGDGELQEGSVWEAAGAAGFLNLQTLVAVVDCNRLQINGGTRRHSGLATLPERWASFGWTVREVDGHAVDAVAGTLATAAEAGRPTVVIAHTVKGRGVPFLENRKQSHYARLSDAQRQRALAALGPADGTDPR